MRERDDEDLAEAFEAIIAREVHLRLDEGEQLREALTTSRCIGMAIGILMSHHRQTQDDAWQMLRKISRDTNRKLRDVAEDVIRLGDLP